MDAPDARRRLRVALLAVGLALLAGCGGEPRTRPPAPDSYVVQRGDTLYSIAWRHGLDYRELARWNDIGRDYRIDVGQRLRLRPPAGAAATAARPAPVRPAPPVARGGPPPGWVWPVARGTVVGPVRQPSGGVGLRIDGEAGAPVRAAADGRVVYRGSALRGYGQLVIVKHANEWLSAYGHNERVLVAEGETVRAGQTIAYMGLGPGQQAMLYFEIRAGGEPVDPLRQLPQR